MGQILYRESAREYIHRKTIVQGQKMADGMQKKLQPRSQLNLSWQIQLVAKREFKIPLSCFFPLRLEKNMTMVFISFNEHKSVVIFYLDQIAKFLQSLYLLTRALLESHAPQAKPDSHPIISDKYN